MSEIYFDGIEVLKGVLILFVILGHLLARTPNIDHFLYVIYLIIYSFSMPLFIGISGFLLNKKFMIGNNIKNILLKYTRRVIIPFLICLSVFAVLNHFNELNIRNLLGYIFLPQVWLWYIPFIIFTTFLVIIFLKLNVSDREILIFCCLISLFWIIFYYLILTPSNPFNIFEKINYTYRPEYICFFAFGYYLRNNEINIEFVQLSYFSLMVFSIYRVYYICITKVISELTINFFTIDFFLLNFSALILLLKKISKMEFKSFQIIKWCGKNSLAIYLWQTPILALVTTLYTKNVLNEFGWLFFNLFGIFLLFVFIFFASKYRFFNEYCFGNVPKKSRFSL